VATSGRLRPTSLRCQPCVSLKLLAFSVNAMQHSRRRRCVRVEKFRFDAPFWYPHAIGGRGGEM
jgi:hypothetical protein